MPKMVAQDGFGVRVRRILRERDLSIAKLAKRAGVTKATLYPIMRADGWPPREPEFYIAIAGALGVDATDLLPPQLAEQARKGEKMEDRLRYGRESFDDVRRRVARPLTTQTATMDCIGRIEHALRRMVVLRKELERQVTIQALAFENLVNEIAKDIETIRKVNLEEIDTNDKGKKV